MELNLCGKVCLATLYDCVLESAGADPSETARQGVRQVGILLVHWKSPDRKTWAQKERGVTGTGS